MPETDWKKLYEQEKAAREAIQKRADEAERRAADAEATAESLQRQLAAARQRTEQIVKDAAVISACTSEMRKIIDGLPKLDEPRAEGS